MCGQEREESVVIDVAEYRALRLLHEGGLVPRLRHQPQLRDQRGA
jgi:hypothetical protein